MLIPSPFNRSRIKEYLAAVSEKDFVEDIIIPLFLKNGFMLLRRVKDGPGEHGKDFIFYRNVSLYFDDEFVVVQAKAEKVTTQNVTKFANQVQRAMTVPFEAKSGVQRYANYVIFANAREHTNDADFEFAHLSGYKQNVKILHQDNIIQLIINENIIPSSLMGQLEEFHAADNELEKKVETIISSGHSLKINRLLDDELHLYPEGKISAATREFVVNYIFYTWSKQRSFDATPRLMGWINLYFHFIQPVQYGELYSVVEEYTSSYRTWAAEADTKQVMIRITPEHVKAFQDDFLRKTIQTLTYEHGFKKCPLLVDLFEEVHKSGILTEDNQRGAQLLQQYLELRSRLRDKKELPREPLVQDLNTVKQQLEHFLDPEYEI